MQLEITPLAGEPFAAVVRGWEPHEPLDAATRAEISEALAEHLVLVFRGQRQPTDAELVRLRRVVRGADQGLGVVPGQR